MRLNPQAQRTVTTIQGLWRDGSTAHARAHHRKSDRAQSEVLGIVLLIGIVTISTTLLAMYATTAITEQQRGVSLTQAERALETIDSRASRVALGDSLVQEVNLGLTKTKGHLDTEPDAGWVRVRTIHPTDGNTTVVNDTLGAIVYRQDDASIGYQAGGIWYTGSDGATVRSRPEFHYHDKTLSLPIIQTLGERAVSSHVQLTRETPAQRVFPNASRGLTNKLENTNGPVVEITVQSEYYEAWAAFFRAETTGGVVTVNSTTQTTTLTMPTLAGRTTLQTGIISTSGTGKFRVAGNGAYTDSYDSTTGSYSETRGSNGTLISAGDVEMSGDSEVRGDIRSGGNVTLGGEATVDGDVYWTESYEPNTATVTGMNESIDGVESLPPITWFVDQRVTTIRQTNHNTHTAIITSTDQLALNPGETGELGPGTYYFEELDVDRSTLVLNTTTGDITIGIENWLRLTNRQGGESSTIRVKGNGTVRVFIASHADATVSPTGLGDRTVNFHVGKNATIDIPRENSTQLRVYGPDTFNATVTGSSSQPATVNAILYAPAGTNGIGYIWVKQGDFYGAVTAGEVTAGQNGAIHFDHATDGTILHLLPGVADIDFMHISRREISIKPAT